MKLDLKGRNKQNSTKLVNAINFIYKNTTYLVLHIITILGGTGISVPQQRTYSKIKEEMAGLVDNGTFLLGELVEGKVFTKTIATPEGILQNDFIIHARRISLDDIRVRLYNEHLNLGKCFKIKPDLKGFCQRKKTFDM